MRQPPLRLPSPARPSPPPSPLQQQPPAPHHRLPRGRHGVLTVRFHCRRHRDRQGRRCRRSRGRRRVAGRAGGGGDCQGWSGGGRRASDGEGVGQGAVLLPEDGAQPHDAQPAHGLPPRVPRRDAVVLRHAARDERPVLRTPHIIILLLTFFTKYIILHLYSIISATVFDHCSATVQIYEPRSESGEDGVVRMIRFLFAQFV
jgi:hypothetical protein